MHLRFSFTNMRQKNIDTEKYHWIVLFLTIKSIKPNYIQSLTGCFPIKLFSIFLSILASLWDKIENIAVYSFC